MVDVIPEETFHEQKLGDVGLWNDDEQCTKKSTNNPTPNQIIVAVAPDMLHVSANLGS